jgi:hypothetical protein
MFRRQLITTVIILVIFNHVILRSEYHRLISYRILDQGRITLYFLWKVHANSLHHVLNFFFSRNTFKWIYLCKTRMSWRNWWHLSNALVAAGDWTRSHGLVKIWHILCCKLGNNYSQNIWRNIVNMCLSLILDKRLDG